MKFIGVIDCNNFFVSCERLFRPDLRKVPVVVLSSNDGCVVARSQEIKDKGIPMGVPYFQIKDTLKDIGAVSFSSHFALYRDISARVFSVVKKHCGLIEQYSIDEAFFEYEAETLDEVVRYIENLKAKVEKQVGIPVSIGVSDTKTRAKQVNAFAKKNEGIEVVIGDDFLSRFGSVSVSDVWGIGRQLSVRYREAKIFSIRDLVDSHTKLISRLTQKPGLVIQAELAGIAIYQVSSVHELPQSITSSRSFAKKTNDLPVIQDALSYHIRHVFEDLRAQSLVATGMRVLLLTSRHGDYRFFSKSNAIDFSLPTSNTKESLQIGLQLLEGLYERGVPYIKTGVVLYGLIPESFVPTSLFGKKSDEGLDDVVDSLNIRYGREKIRFGMFKKDGGWESRGEVRSPAYTTDWHSIKIVYATD